MNSDITLTDQEAYFCDLLVDGGFEYTGKIAKCYKTAFNTDDHNAGRLARRLLKREDVQAYIKEMGCEDEDTYLKMFLTEKLTGIVDEMSSFTVTDRFGNEISPAGTRAVAVNAAKALMDLHPLKAASRSEVSFNGGEGGGGITFNLIVPNQNKEGDNE